MVITKILGLLILFSCGTVSSQDLKIVEQIDIAPVWSGHRVGFDMLTVADQQYVTYYNAERKMTVAKRNLNSDQWQYPTLPSTIGWVSHNYMAMVTDDSGYIHISGNMHTNPLVYFCSTAPRSIDNFTSPGMVGTLEDKVTYPSFINIIKMLLQAGEQEAVLKPSPKL